MIKRWVTGDILHSPTQRAWHHWAENRPPGTSRLDPWPPPSERSECWSWGWKPGCSWRGYASLRAQECRGGETEIQRAERLGRGAGLSQYAAQSGKKIDERIVKTQRTGWWTDEVRGRQLEWFVKIGWDRMREKMRPGRGGKNRDCLGQVFIDGDWTQVSKLEAKAIIYTKQQLYYRSTNAWRMFLFESMF